MKKSTKNVVLGMLCIIIVLCVMDNSIVGCVLALVALMVVAPFEELPEENNPRNNNKNKFTPK